MAAILATEALAASGVTVQHFDYAGKLQLEKFERDYHLAQLGFPLDCDIVAGSLRRSVETDYTVYVFAFEKTQLEQPDEGFM